MALLLSMSTPFQPAGSKRRAMLEEDLSSAIPTRKAQRQADDAQQHADDKADDAHALQQSFSEHHSALTKAVRALGKLDPLCLSDAMLDDLALARDELHGVISRSELAQQTPDQALLPTDELVLVLSWLPASQLGVAARVCCHFKAAVRQCVRHRLDSMFHTPFRPRYGQPESAALLCRLEEQSARLPVLLRSLQPSLAAGGVDELEENDELCEIIEELSTIDEHVLREHLGGILAKIAALGETPLTRVRSELFDLVNRSCRFGSPVRRADSDELTRLAVAELGRGDHHCAFGAWHSLMALPPEATVGHIAVVLPFLDARSTSSHMAIAALQRLPTPMLAGLHLERHLEDFVDHSTFRDEKRHARQLLGAVRAHALGACALQSQQE